MNTHTVEQPGYSQSASSSNVYGSLMGLLTQPVSAMWKVQKRMSHGRTGIGQQIKNRKGTKHCGELTDGAKDETGKRVQRGPGSKCRISVHMDTIITILE